jgi:ACS family tartrate transporter-like MFS transporter
MSSQPAVGLENLEKKTIRKLQRRILPYILLLYIVAYLDRVNIGFAALTMNRSLAISSQQFGLLAGIFFFGYFLFEIPSNLLLHKIGPRVWIARILISWGIVSMMFCMAQNVVHVYILRFLLGVAEAGFFPGIILYLTYWFRQREQAQAVAFFMTAVPLSNILGAPVSGLILDHVHWFGLSGWRWLFVLEALPAVLLGVLTYYLLPSRPAEARFLTEQERDWITAELMREEQRKLQQRRMSAIQALMDLRVWHVALLYFLLLSSAYGIVFWMPQIVKSLSRQWSNTVVGVVVTIPFLAAAIAMVVVSKHSDRTLERRYHIAVPSTIGAMALLALFTTHSPVLSVALLSIAAMGDLSSRGPVWSVPSRFLSGFSAASGIALINSIGNLGGFAGPYALGYINKKTGSLQGGLAFLGICVFLAAVLAVLLPREKQLASPTRAEWKSSAST